MADSPSPPAGLGPRGSAFWARVAEGFDLAVDEHELLVEIARQLDLVEDLQARLVADGVMSIGSQGQPVAHPAIPQINTGRQLLGRLLAQLSLPNEDDEPTVLSPAQATAKKAAETRWAMERAKRDRPARGGRRGA